MNVSYWLVPRIEQAARYQRVIDDLAARFGTASFEPHITIYSGVGSESEAIEQLDAVCGMSVEPMRVSGLGHSPAFTKAVFLELDSSVELTAMSECLRESAGTPSDYLLRPHLSLIYERLEGRVRTQLVAELVKEFGIGSSQPEMISGSELVAIAHEGVDRADDVRGWRIVDRRVMIPS